MWGISGATKGDAVTAIRGAKKLLPPKPEVPPEPWRGLLSTSFDGTWVVLDRSGKRVAADIPNQPTAELLASSWKLQRDKDAAVGLLRKIRCQLAQPGLGSTSTRTLIALIDGVLLGPGT